MIKIKKNLGCTVEKNAFLNNENAFALFDEKGKLIAWNHAFSETFSLSLLTPKTSFLELLSEVKTGDSKTFLLGNVTQKTPTDEDKTTAKVFIQNRPFWALSEKSLSGHVLTQYFEPSSIPPCCASNQELEDTVRRRTLQLEDANFRLRRALRANTRIANALQRNEARLRLINDTIPIQIGYVDKNKIYQYANKGYSDWFGNPKDFATGRSIPEVIGEKVYEQVKDKVDLALSGEQVSYEYSFEREGTIHFAHSTLVPELGSEGETLGFFVFSYNITEQKRLQAALLHAQKMEAIGQLTGGLAHDFNNLLTVIIGNLAALVDHYPQKTYLKEYIEPALRSSRRGVHLIRRLLTFSRRQEICAEVVDIGRLIHDFEQLIRRFLPETIEFICTYPSTPAFAFVDPSQLESAIVNFALNSRDAMPYGGVLKIAVFRQDVNQQSAQNLGLQKGAYLTIEIVDDGKGMSEEVLARALEPFFTTKRFGLGSGLGLAMANGFAQEAGGALHLKSALNQGTTVQLFIPEYLEKIKPKKAKAALTLKKRTSTVLLAEDDKSVRRVVRGQLVDLGYFVIEAENGKQALEILEKVSDIAFLLSDIIMPGGLTGHQLAETVTEKYPHIHLILMSGYYQEAEPLDAIPILRKPFDKKDLIEMLNRF